MGLDAITKRHDATLKSLQAEVANIKERLQSLQEDRCRVLLGQVAYTFDAVAREYVFGPNCGFMTIVELNNYYRFQELKPEEMERYEEFCTFIKQKGCGVDKLIAMLVPLRGARREPARGRPEELRSVTVQQLRQWAPECRVPVQSLNAVLPLLQLFTLPDQPLVPCQNASKAIRQELGAPAG